MMPGNGIAYAEREEVQTMGTTAGWRSPYVREFPGRAAGRARYIKEVDANETTVRFAQEIYDSTGRLIAVHEKFPVDLGHRKV